MRGLGLFLALAPFVVAACLGLLVALFWALVGDVRNAVAVTLWTGLLTGVPMGVIIATRAAASPRREVRQW